MVKTASTMRKLGTEAPDFRLRQLNGELIGLNDFEDSEVLVVMFICNHCPFVKHIRQGLADFGRDYLDLPVGIVAINSNDVSTHPEDSPEAMELEARDAGYTFPYVYDETQEVARAFRAACTPDFFVFDKNRRLVYRGQFDSSRPGNELPVSGSDLRQAVDALLQGRPVSQEQRPSVGCNIKWKAGFEPDYFAV